MSCGPGFGCLALLRSVWEEMERNLSPKVLSSRLPVTWWPGGQSSLEIAGLILISFWCSPSSSEIRLLRNGGLLSRAASSVRWQAVSLSWKQYSILDFPSLPCQNLAHDKPCWLTIDYVC